MNGISLETLKRAMASLQDQPSGPDKLQYFALPNELEWAKANLAGVEIIERLPIPKIESNAV